MILFLGFKWCNLMNIPKGDQLKREDMTSKHKQKPMTMKESKFKPKQTEELAPVDGNKLNCLKTNQKERNRTPLSMRKL